MPIVERIMVAVGIAALCSGLSMLGVAHAQTTSDQVGSIALGARGGFSADSRTVGTQPQDRPENAFGYTLGVGMASDYIYRGVTLSDHRLAVGAAFEARFGSFYGGSTITSVKLPTDPAAELSFSSGVRPSWSGIDFDFGLTYFLYPGEVSTTGTDYWEFVVRADKKLTEKVRVAAGFGYSPNISNTGAWSKYTAAGIGVDLPTSGILQGVSASFATSAGYF